MSFNADQFRAALQGDGARANLFEVTLQFPPWVIGGSNAAAKSSFMVKAAQLPGSSIGIAPLYYFGREVKLAGNRTYQDWSVQIINDEDFAIRNALDAWMNGLNDPANNIRDPNATVVDGGYGVDALITQYGKAGAVLNQYNFIGIWPEDISPIELDWQANDTIEDFTCTFAVQYWTNAALSGGITPQ
jgi:hypothetical protein